MGMQMAKNTGRGSRAGFVINNYPRKETMWIKPAGSTGRFEKMKSEGGNFGQRRSFWKRLFS